MRSDVTRLADDPRAFFSDFDEIVLIANSPDVARHLPARHAGSKTLFVFFNKVFRIIDKPFEGASLLISRSSPVGSSLIYRKELQQVTALLDGPLFRGILNVRVGAKELLSPKADFKRPDVAHLDLVAFAQDIYPKGERIPSTGFAFALWLARLKLGKPIKLAGFSGMRQDTWRVYDVHDWTWEQTLLQLFFRKGLLTELSDDPSMPTWPVEAFLAAFPEIEREEVSQAAAQVLSARLAGANRAIDSLFRTVKPQMAVAAAMRYLRPKSRKVRAREQLLERIQKEEGGSNPLAKSERAD